MSRSILAAAMLFGVAALAHAQPASLELTARGDGAAKLAMQADGAGGVLRVEANFSADILIKDSSEAHARSRWFTGEIRIDGKPCSDARGRLRPDQGRAVAQAGTSCSIGVNGDKPVTIEAIVLKGEDVDRDEIRVDLRASKVIR